MHLEFKKLHLSNFSCFYGHHEFNLSRTPGLYFLTGNNLVQPSLTSNGVGKSSIVNALYWALTSKTLRVQRPGSSIEAWNTTATVSVTLELLINDESYLITRTRRPNSLTINGQVVDQDAVDSLIRLNEETLKRTLVVGQFVPLFLDLKSDQQSSLFSEALNLDQWLQSAERATQNVRRIEDVKDKLQLHLASLNGKLEQIQEQIKTEKDRESQFDYDKVTKQQILRRDLELALREQAAAKKRERRVSSQGTDPARPCSTEAALLAVRAALQEKTALLAESVSTLRLLNQQKLDLGNDLDDYSLDATVCPECGQEVNQQHIKDKHDEISKQLTKVEGQIDTELETATTLEAEVADLRDQLDKAELDHRNELAVKLQKQREAYELEAAAKLVDNKVNSLSQALDNLQDQDNPYTQSCLTLKQRFKDMAVDKRMNEDKLTILHEDLTIYKMWSGAYKEIRLNLIDETLQELEIAANRSLQQLGLDDWLIEFKTERENKSGTISHTFTALIYPNNQPNPIPFESYSGGESQRLQLAVTTALSEVLLSRAGIEPNIEIFDEPSRHMSKEGITDLLECLRERALTLNRAIFFVDHNSIDSGYFDDIIRIEKDENGSRFV